MSDKEKFHQFESTMLSCRHVFSNGKIAHFVNGVFRTNIEGEVAELQSEIKARNPYLSYRGEVTADDFDPLAKIKKQAVADYIAQVAAQQAKTRDLGSTGSAVTSVSGMATSAAPSGVTPQTGEAPVVSVPKTEGSAVKVNLTAKKP